MMPTQWLVTMRLCKTKDVQQEPSRLQTNRKPSQRKKRSELTTINRRHDRKYGKASRAGKDASHTKHGIVYKKSSVNRGSKSDMAGDRRARGKKK